MIARTVASTSADVSRLVSRNARNFCAKSPERVSRRIAMVLTCTRAVDLKFLNPAANSVGNFKSENRTGIYRVASVALDAEVGIRVCRKHLRTSQSRH